MVYFIHLLKSDEMPVFRVLNGPNSLAFTKLAIGEEEWEGKSVVPSFYLLSCKKLLIFW